MRRKKPGKQASAHFHACHKHTDVHTRQPAIRSSISQLLSWHRAVILATSTYRFLWGSLLIHPRYLTTVHPSPHPQTPFALSSRISRDRLVNKELLLGTAWLEFRRRQLAFARRNVSPENFGGNAIRIAAERSESSGTMAATSAGRKIRVNETLHAHRRFLTTSKVNVRIRYRRFQV